MKVEFTFQDLRSFKSQAEAIIRAAMKAFGATRDEIQDVSGQRITVSGDQFAHFIIL